MSSRGRREEGRREKHGKGKKEVEKGEEGLLEIFLRLYE